MRVAARAALVVLAASQADINDSRRGEEGDEGNGNGKYKHEEAAGRRSSGDERLYAAHGEEQHEATGDAQKGARDERAAEQAHVFSFSLESDERAC
jgi:hypothetical protein